MTVPCIVVSTYKGWHRTAREHGHAFGQLLGLGLRSRPVTNWLNRVLLRPCEEPTWAS
jgi:hypothetical protein